MENVPWTSVAALAVAVASFILNVVIYRNNKRKADESRITELEASVGKKIKDIGTDLGKTLSEDIAQHREESETQRKEFEARIDGHDEQLARIEIAAKNAPSHSDLGEIYETINDVAKELSGVSGKLDQVAINVQMLLTRITEKGLG